MVASIWDEYARIFVLGHYLFLEVQVYALGKLFASRNR